MEVRTAQRLDGELLEIVDESGRCIGEVRCNDLAYQEQFRALAFNVRAERSATIDTAAPPARPTRVLAFLQMQASR